MFVLKANVLAQWCATVAEPKPLTSPHPLERVVSNFGGFFVKAEIKKDGTLYITAETPSEAYALKYLYPTGEEHICDTCHRIKPRAEHVIDCSVLINEVDC